MIRTSRIGAAAVSVGLITFLAACGTTSSVDPGSSPSFDPDDNSAGMIAVAKLGDVVGRYQSINTVRSPTKLVDGTTITLEILDGQIAVDAGCNRMTGAASVRDSRLVVTSLAMTEMGCDPDRMDQDTWVATYLTNKPRLERSGPVIALTWSDGWIGFERTEDQTMPSGAPTNPDTPVSSQ